MYPIQKDLCILYLISLVNKLLHIHKSKATSKGCHYKDGSAGNHLEIMHEHFQVEIMGDFPDVRILRKYSIVILSSKCWIFG